jgi:hypothetical protein
MSTQKYDIEIYEGDTVRVGCVLTEGGLPSNLEGFDLTLHMFNQAGDEFEIEVSPGKEDPITREIIVPASEGGITIPFTTTQSNCPGRYKGKVQAVNGPQQATFPDGNKYTDIMIWEAPWQ